MSLADVLGGLGDIQKGYLTGQRAADQHQQAQTLQALRALAIQQHQQEQQAMALSGRVGSQIPQAPQMPTPMGGGGAQMPQLPQVPQATMQMGGPGSVKGSWYGNYGNWRDPNDSGLQAGGQPVSAGPGIALPSRSTLGQEFDVTAPNGITQRLAQTDIGPAASTGRKVDVNAPAAEGYGYTPKTFPTDQQFIVKAVQQVTGPVAMQQAQGGAPMPAVKNAHELATNAGADIPQHQWGGSSLPQIFQAIDKVEPGANPVIKYLAASQLHKLMAPDASMQFREIMQSRAQEFRAGLAEFAAANQKSRDESRQETQKEIAAGRNQSHMEVAKLQQENINTRAQRREEQRKSRTGTTASAASNQRLLLQGQLKEIEDDILKAPTDTPEGQSLKMQLERERFDLLDQLRSSAGVAKPYPRIDPGKMPGSPEATAPIPPAE